MSENEFGHITVLLTEAVDAMQISPSGRYIDGTFGRGGHSKEILQKLGVDGQLLAIDKDPDAQKVADERFSKEDRFYFRQGSFTDMNIFVKELRWDRLDGILLDLGVSSPQLDRADRGFSFLQDGPLDMRMNPEAGISAEEWVNTEEEAEIARVLWDYGEERFSRRMAKAIVKRRQEKTFSRTQDLAEVIAQANPRWEKNKHPATRAFQAIRIHINRELDDLKVGLHHAFELLTSGGRLVVISFHSLEDRITKTFMRDIVRGPAIPKWVPIQDTTPPKARVIMKNIRASEQELAINPRARSAVMRVLEKCE